MVPSGFPTQTSHRAKHACQVPTVLQGSQPAVFASQAQQILTLIRVLHANAALLERSQPAVH
eukprot:COSAG05_NODE_3281_length_2180_cov_1.518020_1_plen_62_part_00